jgi:hypothetical protein
LLALRDEKVKEQTVIKENGETVVIELVPSARELREACRLILGDAYSTRYGRAGAAPRRARRAQKREIVVGIGLERRVRKLESWWDVRTLSIGLGFCSLARS